MPSPFANPDLDPESEFMHAFSRATVPQQLFTKLFLALEFLRGPECAAPEALKHEVILAGFKALRTAFQADLIERLISGHDGRDGKAMLDRVAKAALTTMLRMDTQIDTFEKLAARAVEIQDGPAQ